MWYLNFQTNDLLCKWYIRELFTSMATYSFNVNKPKWIVVYYYFYIARFALLIFCLGFLHLGSWLVVVYKLFSCPCQVLVFMRPHIMSCRMFIFILLSLYKIGFFFCLKCLEFAKENHLGLITDSVSYTVIGLFIFPISYAI